MASSAQTLPSLLVPSDAAGLGTASANVAATPTAYQVENNVAGMSFSPSRFSAGVSYGMWQPAYASDKVISAGAMWRSEKRLAIGLSFKYFAQPSYDITTESGNASREGSYTPKEFNAAVGVSYRIVDFLSLGLSARLTKSDIAPETSSNVFGVDAGVFFQKNNIRAGISANNLGSKVKYGENTYSQPSLVKAGAGYTIGLGASSIAVNAEADVLFSGGFMAGLGAEYSFDDLVFVRAGYHYGDDKKAIPSYGSLGAGVKFFGVRLDVAYLVGSQVLKTVWESHWDIHSDNFVGPYF